MDNSESFSSSFSKSTKTVIAPDLFKLQAGVTTIRTKSWTDTNKPAPKATTQVPAQKSQQITDSELPVCSSPQKITLTELPSFQKFFPRVNELVMPSLTQPYLFKPSSPPVGILLTGPCGCGKTAFANAIANEFLSSIPKLSFFGVIGTQLIASKTGDTERQIREIFALAEAANPSIILIDQLEAIAADSSGSTREYERRVVAQLCTCLDSVKNVFVIATAQEAGKIDKQLRRPGRFDCEIEIPIPGRADRQLVIQQIVGNSLEKAEVAQLARITPGYVPADLRALHREAVIYMWKNDIQMNMVCFEQSINMVQPISRREGLATVPDTSLDDIGGLVQVKKELDLWILKPIQNPEFYKQLGLQTSAGVILYGAPGNGKTLLGKALANQAECNFISVKGPELLNQYVGESERAVRQLFEKARSARPVIVFLDECECLCRQRGSGSNSEVTDRVVNQFLTELDGVCSDREGVFVVAATNRVDLLDRAIMRPGRLEKAIYVPLPNLSERVDILRKLMGKCKICSDVNNAVLEKICENMEGFSGADLQAVVREGGLNCVSRNGVEINAEDFVIGSGKVRRSVSDQDLHYYKQQEKQMQ
ncbi:AAA family ATPase [Spironucleus salmonicida]|uniref:AAA family ATPase n=1 Tax=Spironucleus salmonicida TaxID=348837 RepID=V6M148_9EUKA|nr:AAA family ATPase [Spironucleus salmonicida]|eukprot:EST46894.1 AAA family ATPase [Spironucleus salmonicida]